MTSTTVSEAKNLGDRLAAPREIFVVEPVGRFLRAHIAQNKSTTRPKNLQDRAQHARPVFEMMKGELAASKSKLRAANGSAAPSACSQAISGALRRACRSMPNDRSRPAYQACGSATRLAIS